jgi:acyl-CoA dehydrogenase
VVASVGVDASSKNRLRVVRVAKDAPGVTVRPMPPPPFAPEIPHAEVDLDGVQVTEADVLPGDGYEDYLKPFRTIEDVYVHGALSGYLLGVARRSRSKAVARRIGRIAAVIVGGRAVAALDPKDAVTHVVLAGLIDEVRDLVEGLSEAFLLSPAEERDRFERDKPLLKVAERAREARRERAWEVLAGGGSW